MRAAALFLVALCAVSAQDAPTPTAAPADPVPDAPPQEMDPSQVSPMDGIAAMVGMQQQVASKYLDVILRFQYAQYETYAAMFFMQEAMAKHQIENPSQNLEEDVSLEEEEGSQPDPAKFRLMATYFLLNSIHVKLYRIIVKAPEIQGEYYFNRVIQMSANAGGMPLPPQLYQALYLNNFNSHMKTLKLSYALQYVSHFRTWLEDEIDVNAVVAAKEPNYMMVAMEQQGDLVQDKVFAFQSYNSLAQIDYQTFLLDMFVQNMFQTVFAQAAQANAAAGGSPAASSFLEEGAEAEFLPFALGMGMGAAGGGGMQMYTIWIRYYQLIMQFSAAQAGQTSVTLEHFARNTDAKEPEKLMQASTYSFTAFASSLMQEAHMQYMLAIFDMYSLYGSVGPAAGGSGMPTTPGGPAYAAN